MGQRRGRLTRAERARVAAAPPEDPACTAICHRPDYRSLRYRKGDGCICPSTLARAEQIRQAVNAAQRRRDHRNTQVIPRKGDMRLADRRDAEALAMGYRIPPANARQQVPGTSLSTRMLAVRLMLRQRPQPNATEMGMRLGVTVRAIERYKAALRVRAVQRGDSVELRLLETHQEIRAGLRVA